MNKNYFETNKLTVGYNDRPLIKEISLGLKKGEILTLIGPNGSGKSTILKSISKHLKKISGKVYIEAIDMHKISYKDMATKLAVVLTERIRPELMTCWELVATGRYPYTNSMGILSEFDKHIVNDSLIKVHALDLADKSFDEISDGQRQRILLARAICQQPDIIILDEPTSFLDIKHKLELLAILKDMSREDGITIVMSLHEIDLAQRISDKIVCVDGERIKHYGTPKDIFKEEIIKELYSIEKGSFNINFGSVELKKPDGEPKLFVIAGGATGAMHFRELQKNNIPFAVGVLHKNDIDYEVALSLATEIVSEAAFNSITDESFNRALEIMEKCDSILYTGVEFGLINARNKDLLEIAKEKNIPIEKHW